MMDDWNVRRKARGRIRRAKSRRRRQRITAASLMLLLLLSVFAVGSVRYGETRSTETRVATQHQRSYTMPRISPLLARAEVVKRESQLPQVLNFEERFPDYRNPPSVEDPNLSSGDEDAPPPVDATQELVILDDLRAAPPKSMFINAVFDNTDHDTAQEDSGSRWVFNDDPADSNLFDLTGHTDEGPIPAVPEPGSSTLLGLGLATLAVRRKLNGRRRE